MPRRSSPARLKWVWLSIKPGEMKRPSSSITRVPFPRKEATSGSEPTATMRLPLTATASAQGFASSPVHTRPPVKITSASWAPTCTGSTKPKASRNINDGRRDLPERCCMTPS